MTAQYSVMQNERHAFSPKPFKQRPQLSTSVYKSVDISNNNWNTTKNARTVKNQFNLLNCSKSKLKENDLKSEHTLTVA